MTITAVDESSPAAGYWAGWRRAVVGLISALVVVLLGWAAWWMTHPHVLYPAGNGVGWTLVVGQTGAIETGIVADRNQYESPPQPVTISVHRVIPVITTNTANAEVTVMLCEGRNAGGIGVVFAADVPQYCESTTPVAASSVFDFNYLDLQQQLFVLITPRTPGTVVINGFRVSYEDGLRRGTQLTGINIEVQAQAG